MGRGYSSHMVIWVLYQLHVSILAEEEKLEGVWSLWIRVRWWKVNVGSCEVDFLLCKRWSLTAKRLFKRKFSAIHFMDYSCSNWDNSCHVYGNSFLTSDRSLCSRSIEETTIVLLKAKARYPSQPCTILWSSAISVIGTEFGYGSVGSYVQCFQMGSDILGEISNIYFQVQLFLRISRICIVIDCVFTVAVFPFIKKQLTYRLISWY